MLLFFDNPYDLTTVTAIERGWQGGSTTDNTLTGATIATTHAPRARSKMFVASHNGGAWIKTPGNDGGPSPSGARIILGHRYLSPAFNSHYMFGVFQGGSWQGYLGINGDGTLSWYRGTFGSGTLVVGPTAYALNTNTCYYIELDLLIDNSVGTVDVYIDGVLRLSGTGLDTQATASASWNQFALAGGSFNNGQQFCTDAYCCDGADGTAASPAQLAAFNTPLGDVKVEYIGAQAGNGTYTDWTCSTGTDRGAMVDDGTAGPDDDSTYVSSATPGDKVSVALEDLPVTTVDVIAVMPVASMTKNDAGSRTVKPLHRIGGSDYFGTAIEAPAQGSYRFLVQVMTKSPATGIAWTPTEINGMEGGVAIDA